MRFERIPLLILNTGAVLMLVCALSVLFLRPQSQAENPARVPASIPCQN